MPAPTNFTSSKSSASRHDMSVILVTGSYDHEIRFWEAWSGICSRTIARSQETGVSVRTSVRRCSSPRWLMMFGPGIASESVGDISRVSADCLACSEHCRLIAAYVVNGCSLQLFTRKSISTISQVLNLHPCVHSSRFHELTLNYTACRL